MSTFVFGLWSSSQNVLEGLASIIPLFEMFRTLRPQPWPAPSQAGIRSSFLRIRAELQRILSWELDVVFLRHKLSVYSPEQGQWKCGDAQGHLSCHMGMGGVFVCNSRGQRKHKNERDKLKWEMHQEKCPISCVKQDSPPAFSLIWANKFILP